MTTKPDGWAIKHPIRGVDGSTAYGLKKLKEVRNEPTAKE